MVTALPVWGEGVQSALEGSGLVGVFGQGEGFAAGLLEEFAVAERVGYLEAEVAGLAGAEEFARAAQLQIGFGDFESIVGADHGVEAGAGFLGGADGSDEDAVGFFSAAADASTELVQLREAETLGVLDDHYCGVGNVDAYFYYRSGDEDLHFVFSEALHDVFFFFAGKPAVKKAELEIGENLSRETLKFVDGGFELQFRFFDDRIHDVALMAGGDFAPERFPDAGEMRLGGGASDNGSAAGRKLVENGDVEIAVERQ